MKVTNSGGEIADFSAKLTLPKPKETDDGYQALFNNANRTILAKLRLIVYLLLVI